jgi:hypothetical protein
MTNDEKQKEHCAANQFFSSLLGHSILTTLVKMLLYGASAYVLARWLYGAKPR